ncbi:NAD(P)H-binding protein [Mycobacterium sp. 663a-19]|uniref:SDR family oxidoreductase n=1 Tax=Mycobacterium sp. 663a-19 TaxID=2986148 RepID=UPI002D1E59CF|nr:NAD(P)H-binding protein [Mycobacterium sp. 663a-19]MEB3982132.1 NAD(P)H-binding protein [Mycobacterium sp. 663a-19]
MAQDAQTEGNQRRERETTIVAVVGATGTAGSRVIARLKGRGVSVVGVARAHGVDLISGHGLTEALDGVDVVIDASNPIPPDGHADIVDTLTTATHNLVSACAAHEVQRLVVLTPAGVEDPTLDGLPYYAAKRAAKEIVLDGPVPATIVKSTQWHEFATNPAAVTCDGDEVVAEDWLIQPIAADTVADVLVEAALCQTRAPRTIAGPQDIRLPELTSKLLASQGDGRRVRAVQPAVTALAGGALLAPTNATVLGPDVDTWLETVATDGANGLSAEETEC